MAPEHQAQVDELKESISRAFRELVEKVEALADKVDAIYSFQAAVSYAFSRVAGGYSESDDGLLPAWVELVAFYLFPRFGNNSNRDPATIQLLFDTLDELNVSRPLDAAFGVIDSDKDVAAIQSSLALFSETVRGNAYPPQTIKQIRGIQCRFDPWFRSKIGITPSRCLAVLEAFQKCINDNQREKRERLIELIEHTRVDSDCPPGVVVRATTTDDQEVEDVLSLMSSAFFLTYDQVSDYVENLTISEWNALRDLVGLTVDRCKTLRVPREVQHFPLYFLPDDQLTMFSLSCACDALFEAFDRLARSDRSFCDKTYMCHLSAWMETEVESQLKQVFGSDYVYKNIQYPDPDVIGGIAEVDVVVWWEPFLLVVEVKGKQFRSTSKTGRLSHFRSDIKANVEDSFRQSQRVLRYVDSVDQVRFDEKDSERRLCFNRSDVSYVFPVSVTLRHLSGFTTQLASLRCLGLFSGKIFPWAVSLADFQMVAQFTEYPEAFVHYIKRRIDLQESEIRIHGDELDLLGAYLDTRLHPSDFWKGRTRSGESAHMIGISGFTGRFDEWYQVDQGLRKERPVISLRIPERFRCILADLSRSNDGSSRRMVFSILELSNKSIEELDDHITLILEESNSSTRAFRKTVSDDGVVVSVMSGDMLTFDSIEAQTSVRAALEKERFQATVSLAIFIKSWKSSIRVVHAACCVSPWESEPFLREKLDQEKPLYKGRLPGRNARCVCGGPKKFKNCCMRKFKT